MSFNSGICLQYVQLLENLANQTRGVGPFIHFSRGQSPFSTHVDTSLSHSQSIDNPANHSGGVSPSPQLLKGPINLQKTWQTYTTG